ncbi:MAG TPA: hypothetical protein VMV92_16720 [Streptosporangiaceae bacterium]|nr:hypothetical protein [Streptosporangiaceae bacterium]
MDVTALTCSLLEPVPAHRTVGITVVRAVDGAAEVALVTPPGPCTSGDGGLAARGINRHRAGRHPRREPRRHDDADHGPATLVVVLTTMQDLIVARDAAQAKKAWTPAGLEEILHGHLETPDQLDRDLPVEALVRAQEEPSRRPCAGR